MSVKIPPGKHRLQDAWKTAATLYLSGLFSVQIYDMGLFIRVAYLQIGPNHSNMKHDLYTVMTRTMQNTPLNIDTHDEDVVNSLCFMHVFIIHIYLMYADNQLTIGPSSNTSANKHSACLECMSSYGIWCDAWNSLRLRNLMGTCLSVRKFKSHRQVADGWEHFARPQTKHKYKQSTE